MRDPANQFACMKSGAERGIAPRILYTSIEDREFCCQQRADEQAYLHGYFGESAGDYRLARFFLMRQVAHIFYATIFLSLAAAAGKAIDTSLDAPDFRGFQRRILAGEVSLADAEAKLQYGLVHLKQTQQNIRTPRFQDALRTIPTEYTWTLRGTARRDVNVWQPGRGHLSILLGAPEVRQPVHR